MRPSSRLLGSIAAAATLAACSGPTVDTPSGDGMALASASPGEANASASGRPSASHARRSLERDRGASARVAADPVAARAPLWSVASGGTNAEVDSDGNVDVLAWSHLFEVDVDGHVQWDRTLAVPAGESWVPSELATTESGTVLVAGAWHGATEGGFFLLAFDTSGAPMWERRWVDATASDGPEHADLAVHGHVIGLVGPAYTHVMDCDGAALWDAPVGGTVLRFGADGDAYVGGSVEGRRAVTRLRAADGAPVWSTVLEDTAGTVTRDERVTAMVVDDGGAVYVSGQRRYLPDPRADFGSWESLAAKLGPGGEQVWRHDTELEALTGLVVDEAGRATFAGAYASSNATSVRNLHVRQYGADGAERWTDASTRWMVQGVGPLVARGAAGAVYTAATYDSGRDPMELTARDRDGAITWQASGSGLVRALAADARSVYLVTDRDVARYAP